MPLYPDSAPNASGYLKVSDLHAIYYEDCGSTTGLPVVYVHGGPGGGIQAEDKRYFDPTVYRIILFDQRGAGKSLPSAELEDNTTWDLVADMERLRADLRIDKWIVFGGSWGSTLSLAYAQAHTDRCLGLILRGIFTLRRKELLWFYQSGASFLFPEYFADFVAPIPEAERGDLMAAYYKRLTTAPEAERLACATAWSKYETRTSKLTVDPEYIEKSADPKWALAFARIEAHYFVNGGWMRDGQLLEEAHKLRHLDITIVQGRYDVVCPAITAWDLYQALGGEANKKVDYILCENSGHSAHEVEIEEALVKAADKYRSLQQS